MPTCSIGWPRIWRIINFDLETDVGSDLHFASLSIAFGRRSVAGGKWLCVSRTDRQADDGRAVCRRGFGSDGRCAQGAAFQPPKGKPGDKETSIRAVLLNDDPPDREPWAAPIANKCSRTAITWRPRSQALELTNGSDARRFGQARSEKLDRQEAEIARRNDRRKSTSARSAARRRRTSLPRRRDFSGPT